MIRLNHQRLLELVERSRALAGVMFFLGDLPEPVRRQRVAPLLSKTALRGGQHIEEEDRHDQTESTRRMSTRHRQRRSGFLRLNMPTHLPIAPGQTTQEPSEHP